MYGVTAIESVKSILKAEYFYKDLHQTIIQATIDLYNEGKTIDLGVVYERVKGDGISFYDLSLFSKSTIHSEILTHVEIVKERYLLRKIIHDCHTITSMAFDEDYNKAKEAILRLSEELISESDTISLTSKEVVTNVLDFLLINKDQGKTYKFGFNGIDNTLHFNPDNIFLIGGKSGAGKTRLVINMIFNILNEHDDVSVLWYNMEDPSDKIIRGWLGSMVHLTDSQLQQIDYSLSQSDLGILADMRGVLNKFDVEFTEDSATVDEIYERFFKFCYDRKGRFCLLVLDNLMQIDDTGRNQTEVDDKIAKRVKKLVVKTNQKGMKSSIIMLHHFTNEQLAKANLSEGYRPKEDHLRGSTRLRDVSTMIMLMNRPGGYPDLTQEYKHLGEAFKSLILADIVKNRNGEERLIRLFANLGYATFQEIKN